MKQIVIEVPEELEEVIKSLVNNFMELEKILKVLDKYPERKLENIEEIIYRGKVFD